MKKFFCQLSLSFNKQKLPLYNRKKKTQVQSLYSYKDFQYI